MDCQVLTRVSDNVSKALPDLSPASREHCTSLAGGALGGSKVSTSDSRSGHLRFCDAASTFTGAAPFCCRSSSSSASTSDSPGHLCVGGVETSSLEMPGRGAFCRSSSKRALPTGRGKVTSDSLALTRPDSTCTDSAPWKLGKISRVTGDERALIRMGDRDLPGESCRSGFTQQSPFHGGGGQGAKKQAADEEAEDAATGEKSTASILLERSGDISLPLLICRSGLAVALDRNNLDSSIAAICGLWCLSTAVLTPGNAGRLHIKLSDSSASSADKALNRGAHGH